MSIKVLAIITGASLLLTILLFVFTGNSGDKTSTTDGTQPIITQNTPIPTVDVQKPPEQGKAKISGVICPAKSFSLAGGLMVVAEKIPSRQRFSHYVYGPIELSTSYAIEVDPGIYEISSELTNRQKVGLYSQYVLCGLNPDSCKDHALLQIEITTNQTLNNIDICDYDWLK